MSSLNEKLDYLNETKQLIRSSIVQRGLPIDDSVPFRDYASKILEINSDFIDDRDVMNDFTYNTDGYYATLKNGYNANISVLCVGRLLSSSGVLEKEFYVVYQVISVSGEDSYCKVVDILDEYNDYTGTLTPDEYNTALNTAKQIEGSVV